MHKIHDTVNVHARERVHLAARSIPAIGVFKVVPHALINIIRLACIVCRHFDGNISENGCVYIYMQNTVARQTIKTEMNHGAVRSAELSVWFIGFTIYSFRKLMPRRHVYRTK